METVTKFTCQYCHKDFARENSLAVHVCEQKKRRQDRTERGVELGFQAYVRFYEMTQGSAKFKTYDDFVGSPYYNAFVKFGRYLVGVRAVNAVSFTGWLLTHNKKLDHWCKDSFYNEWLHEYLRKENVQDALERGLKEMQDYADNNQDLKNGFRDYFRYGNANRICHHISTGRISAWVVFNCDSGIAFLESLDEVLLTIVLPYIDPDYWTQRLHDYLADAEWCKHILKEAGL